MTDLVREGFEAWQDKCPPPSHAPENPAVLAPTSVFLCEDAESHERAGIYWTGWQWCDSPRLLAGVLLHVILPDIASWLFDETSFDKAERLPLRATVEAALGANQDDRDFFLGIATDLEVIEAEPDPADFPKISAICDRVTAKFNETPTWNFTLEAYPSTVAAGAALFDRHGSLTDPATGEEFTEARWLDLCARAGTDRAASGVVTGVFDGAFVH